MLLPCLRPCRGFYVRHGLAPFVANAVPSPLLSAETCSCHANASVEVKSLLTFRKKDSCSIKVCRSRNPHGCDGPHVYAVQGGYPLPYRRFIPASPFLRPARPCGFSGSGGSPGRPDCRKMPWSGFASRFWIRKVVAFIQPQGPKSALLPEIEFFALRLGSGAYAK